MSLTTEQRVDTVINKYNNACQLIGWILNHEEDRIGKWKVYNEMVKKSIGEALDELRVIRDSGAEVHPAIDDNLKAKRTEVHQYLSRVAQFVGEVAVEYKSQGNNYSGGFAMGRYESLSKEYKNILSLQTRVRSESWKYKQNRTCAQGGWP